MKRSVVFAAAMGVAVLATATGAVAQTNSPLLGNEFNCSDAQAAFGGQPQPASLGSAVSVELEQDCFLVVEVQVDGGQTINVAHLSGDHAALNVAFYEPSAPPGAAFSDPPDIGLGRTGVSRPVPGTGTRAILIALQGVGGPAKGTSSIRVSATAPAATTTTAAPTTVAPTTIAPTTIAPTTVAPATIAPTTGLASTTSTASAASTAALENAALENAASRTTSVASAVTSSGESTAASANTNLETGSSDDGGSTIPWWVLALVVLAALVWLGVIAIRARRPAAPLPWERQTVSWTLQHLAPTGSCSAQAKALVDPDDDGTLAGYNVSTLFALPTTGKRIRTTVKDPLLAQLDALWATQPSGAELRSAVDAYVNTLCRHLDHKRVHPSATLLAEMTKSDVVVHGEVHACVDGSWHMYEGWRDVPDLPAGHVQHDIVQVAVLGLGRSEHESWLDRTDELSEAITFLIDTRRAPAGLWVFD